MAEVTGLRNNALPYPVYGAPWGVVFPLLDADGDPIAPSSPDSEKSLNGDTFADCTNEAVEIATSTGICYLLLTAAELTADVVGVRIQSTGAKTTVLALYPRKLVTIRSGTSASGGVATSTIVLDASASAVDDFYNGMLCIATIDSNVECRIISDYTGSTQTATVVPDWNVAPDSDDTFVIKLPEGVQVNQSNLTAIAGNTTNGTNLGTAASNYSATRGLSGTALPAAAADAAGGLPISDAGGLDLDAKLANTNEVTAARMGALTDWINGGRLDLILDIIAADTTTDIPALIAALNNIAATDIVSGGAITTSGGVASADVKKINAVTIVGDGSGTPFNV